MRDEVKMREDPASKRKETLKSVTGVGTIKAGQRAEEDRADFLASIIQNIPDAVCSIDLDGRILTWNCGAERMLGYPSSEILQRPVTTIIPEELAEKEIEHCIAILNAEGCMSGYETVRVAKDGRKIAVEVTAVALRERENHFSRYASIMRDITDRKRAEEELKRSHEQLSNLAAYLQRVREEERTSVAREIHDELGQALTALKMDTSWLGSKYRDHQTLLEKTRSMANIIDSTIRTVKRICTELRPRLLDDLGLVAAIEWQTSEFLKRTGIECEVAIFPDEIALDRGRSTALFRIFQESLTNVARHAEATEVKVRLEKKADTIVLDIQDNGRGLTRKEISDSRSFGLIGMRERARSFGGEMRITGKKGKGTTVTVVFPLGEEVRPIV